MHPCNHTHTLSPRHSLPLDMHAPPVSFMSPSSCSARSGSVSASCPHCAARSCFTRSCPAFMSSRARCTHTHSDKHCMLQAFARTAYACRAASIRACHAHMHGRADDRGLRCLKALHSAWLSTIRIEHVLEWGPADMLVLGTSPVLRRVGLPQYSMHHLN